MALLEVCVDSLAGLEAARAAGAGRIELCSRLELDGLSPDVALLAAACERASPPVRVMVRPRPGDFVAREGELQTMLAEIRAAQRAPAAGVVLGLLTPEDEVDREAMAVLVAASRPLPVTFHRAFDRVRDPARALEELIELGCDRVLTSGGAPSAFAGRPALARLVQRARGRIVVIAGGGVRAHNAQAILADTGVDELHASVAFALPPGLPRS